VRTLFNHWALPLKLKCVSSQEIALTAENISWLETLAPKFRVAALNRREKMIEEATNHIESFWKQDIEFDRDTVIDVREL